MIFLTRDVRDIKIEWIQQGHSTLDPTGQRQFEMSCLWSRNVTDVELEVAKAEKYAKAQKWPWYLITVK